MERSDIVIIGAGIIGLAVSYACADKPKDILVIEKNNSFGQETSSRNSEVIHSGIYYPPESLKSRTCIRGNRLLYELCSLNNIPYKRLGKLVAARTKEEIAEIDAIHDNAVRSGVPGIRRLSKKEIGGMEPGIEAEAALFCPDTGIVDSHGVMKFFFENSRSKGVDFAFGVEVVDIKRDGALYSVTVKEPGGELFTFRANTVINAAGLNSDKISGLAGIDPDTYSYNLHYCKGQYFRIEHPKKFPIRHLVYPPPSKTDLGIHITPDLAGGLRLGPDAAYVGSIDYSVNEADKPRFLQSVKKFIKALEIEDIIPDTAGIRPKLQGKDEDFRDFVIADERSKGFPGFINLIGIESPGLTASLAIAEIVRGIIL